ncbi:tubulin specific chaperone cofactor B [Schizosaccharomyces osmophilus]|uniref:Tubulin specific chaperone cofactor B n=1 Tax=Schizosaccharomyces osmophilus TaxID=2545709 RepID=A0AAE9WBB0_9SCHI|nr:tubulin specific chaperone cofactor B [Schizosaccharomyces osmophilus]WBW73177.1 tubulin specific chaperone cofactor B [Schizosaccharomyces osmophilus]
MNDIYVNVRSSGIRSDRKINRQWTLSQLKTKLVPIIGIPEVYQKVKYEPASAASQTHTFSSEEENSMLSLHNIEELSTIIIEDTRPPHMRPNYEDLSEVEKYEMSQEEYERRDDSVLAWKKRNHLGRFNPTHEESVNSKQESLERELKDLQVNINSRCCASGERYGTIRYIGFVPEISKNSLWIGVEFDEPVGKNDGTVQGQRYFTTRNKHGSFLKPTDVEVGDFPEEDILADL